MSRTINKTVLTFSGVQNITVPSDARFLHVNNQNDKLCVWYSCTSDSPMSEVEMRVCGTGHDVPGNKFDYVGTALFSDGQFVLHVFARN